MADALILETTFLVDLERERRRRSPGRAHRLLAGHADARLYITHTVAGELAAGKSLADRQGWEAFIGPFVILPITPEVAWIYGRTVRYLQDNGLLIGSNDLWIAATALANQLPVVTGNSAHYRRVPGLQVIDY